MTPGYGRALTSERVSEYVPDTRFEQTTVISSIRANGKQVSMMIKGAINGDVFNVFVREVLAPTLKKGDIVILDNLSSHKVKGVLDPIFERGATVKYLPPYSPDYNPIELCWSKMKYIVRKLKPRSFDELVFAIKMALAAIIKENAINWFKHCGYIRQ